MSKTKPLGAWRNIGEFMEMFRTGKIDDELLLVADKDGRIGWGKVLTTNDKPEKNVWGVVWFNLSAINNGIERLTPPTHGGTNFSKEINQGSLRYFQPFVVPIWVENAWHMGHKGYHLEYFGRHTRDAFHRRKGNKDDDKRLPINTHIIIRKKRRKPAELSWLNGKPPLVSEFEERERAKKEKKADEQQKRLADLAKARAEREKDRKKAKELKKPTTIVVKKRAKR